MCGLPMKIQVAVISALVALLVLWTSFTEGCVPKRKTCANVNTFMCSDSVLHICTADKRWEPFDWCDEWNDDAGEPLVCCEATLQCEPKERCDEKAD